MSRPARLTREQAAIIGAYTGVSSGPFVDLHRYAARMLGRDIHSGDFGDPRFLHELRGAARLDFLDLVAVAELEP